MNRRNFIAGVAALPLLGCNPHPASLEQGGQFNGEILYAVIDMRTVANRPRRRIPDGEIHAVIDYRPVARVIIRPQPTVSP